MLKKWKKQNRCNKTKLKYMKYFPISQCTAVYRCFEIIGLKFVNNSYFLATRAFSVENANLMAHKG